MGFWDDHADLYEQGGITGGQSGPISPEGQPAAAAAFNPAQQVGHDGTINGMNREQYRDAWLSSGAHSMADMQAFTQAHGGTIQSGNGTVMTPFGESLDMGKGARSGNMEAAWGGVGGPGGGSGGGMAQMPMSAYSGAGSVATGYGGGGAGPTGGAGGWDGQKFNYGGDFTPGTLQQTDIARPDAYTSQQFAMPDAFKAPTEADMAQDPSYKFRLSESLGAMQNSAAAKGLIRSGGTFSDLAGRAGEMASQEYGNVYGRKASEYDRAFGNAFNTNQLNNQTAAQAYDLTNRYQQNADIANQGNRFQVGQANISNAAGAHAMNAGNSLAAWQANVGAQLGQGQLANAQQQTANSYGVGMANVGLGYHSADQSYDLGLRNNALGYYGAGNSYALGMGNLDLNRQGQDFNQGFSLAQLGLNAGESAGAYGGQYANASGNNATGAGNAAAAGAVGSANAWANGLGGAANAAAGAYGMYRYGQRPYGASA